MNTKKNTKKLEERYSPEEIRACRGKKSFLTKGSAILEHIRKQQKGLLEPPVSEYLHFLKPYCCGYCGYWHLTKDEHKNLLSFKEQQELKLVLGRANLEELLALVKKMEKKARAAIKNKNNS